LRTLRLKRISDGDKRKIIV